ncbi:MAG: ABC transporter substrate-binding protein [Proteobacteria bacterium]|nr:ABC transporter substrate-binding protein [Pseudomonadota bacterium]MBI3500148.1 ABC transporter substrate-binding protein [Pseudomonadota bacterium]
MRLGFVPLTDCAPLAVAEARGFFRKWGIEATLTREASWANVRDKVAFGALDGGHMLAAMPIAASLGLGGIKTPMITALNLGLNGNAVTLSVELWQLLASAVPEAAADHRLTAFALKRVLERRKSAGAPPLGFAVTFPYASHNYLLRYWLAAAGIDPDRDIRLSVVPPPMMVAHLMARRIDGFCVGEPWNRRAVELGIGRIALTSYEIWNNHPEKVLGVSAGWAERHPDTHQALISALAEAQCWADDPGNRWEVARILTSGRYVDLPEDIVALSLTGGLCRAQNEPPEAVPDFHVFHRNAAGFPWLSHAEWTLTQMRRWGQLDPAVDIAATAAAVYRPDLYRGVAAGLGLNCPKADRKREGEHARPWALEGAAGPLAMGPDEFVDGRVFDPCDLERYAAEPPLRQPPSSQRWSV